MMMKNGSAYFQPEIETLSVSAIRDLQLKGLREMLQRCMQSEFYRRRFREAGVSPEDIRSLDDLQRLPFTTKEDLRENYPFGLCCVPLQECVRLLPDLRAQFRAEHLQRLSPLRGDAVKAPVPGDSGPYEAAVLDLGICLKERHKIDVPPLQKERREPVHGDLSAYLIKQIQYDQFINGKR